MIVDPNFGVRLNELPDDEPVWIIDSPVNTPIASEAWKQRPNTNHYLTGITTFRPVAAYQPEDELIAQLRPVDIHHRSDCPDAPFSILDVLGCIPSEKVRDALAKFGLQLEQATANGFRAIRTSI